MISIAQLEKPIVEARDKLQVNARSAGAVQQALTTASNDLGNYSREHQRQADNTQGEWRGGRSGTFGGRAAPVTEALDSASRWASSTATRIRNAADLINAARKEVSGLIDEFHANVRPLVTIANSTNSGNRGMALQAKAKAERMAAEYAQAAAKIVTGAKGKVAGLSAAGSSTAPSSAPSGTDAAIGSSASQGGSSAGSSAGGGNAPSGGAPVMTPPSTQFGSGTQINLPNGMGTVQAPNERAAIAVRAALTQLGVPYVWGGTSPGSGLDCSGLTQYAYGEGGVELPRHSSEQAMGMKIDQSQLQPGDLIVWDGHVAMYAGNGQMIEAGDPVQMSELRTENSGMPFLGFFRPTA